MPVFYQNFSIEESCQALYLYRQEAHVFFHSIFGVQFIYIYQSAFMQADPPTQPINPQPSKQNLQQQRQYITPEQSMLSQQSDLASLQSDDEQTFNEQHYAKLKQVDKTKQQLSIQKIYQEKIKRNEIQYKKRYQKEYEEENQVVLEHRVDKKYLILLSELRRDSMSIYTAAGLRSGQIRFNVSEGKIIIYTKTKQQGQRAIEIISDYIDKLSLLKIQIKGQAAKRLSNFHKLKKRMLQDKVVMFGLSSKQNRQVFIGGEMKMSQLRLNAEKIKQYKIASFFMVKLKNKRSYKIVINELIKIKSFQESLIKSNILLTEVERENRGRDLKISVAHNSKKQITNVEFDQIYMKLLSNYIVITFILSTEEGQKYLQKLTCENVSFLYLKQRKFPRTYLFIIAHRQIFIQKIKLIQQQVQKIGDKIIGIRFLYFIAPDQRNFQFDEDHYYCLGFPQQKPYSIAFFAKRRQGKTFQWRYVLHSITKSQDKQ